MSTRTDDLLEALYDNRGPFAYAKLAEFHESAIQTAATAALVVRPSTTAAITIWNGENIGGKSLVMDRLFSHQLVSTASAAFCGLWYCLHLEMTKPTNDITTLRGTGDGREPVNSLVIVDVAASVLNDGWFPCGGGLECEPTGVLPGGNLEWECNGRLIVPPHHGISLQVVSSKTSETFTSGASWWRVQL
ncbi:MAG TPA: hypothetical protein VMY35_18885 [Phycisphaerae bacterium]|nr:hypothetical protein [Phycisphaerae bacterium]